MERMIKMKLKSNRHISCPRCIEKNKGIEDLEGVSFGCFKVIELNKLYNFECSLCGLKLEYIINAMPKMTPKTYKQHWDEEPYQAFTDCFKNLTKSF